MPLTADDLAAHLQMQAAPAAGTPARTEFDRFLSTAVAEVTRACGWPDAVEVTARVSQGWGQVLNLPYVRLALIGAVVDPWGVAIVPVWTDPVAGQVGLPAAWPGVYTVTVTGSPWPDALRVAALEWARHLYASQRTRLRPNEDDPSPMLGFALPNRVAELITPYRSPGIA